MKLFSTKLHGVLDYATVANLPALFRLLGASADTVRLADRSALFVLAYSLLTRYERGAIKVLPMPVHLAFDALLGTVLCAAASRPGERTGVKAALLSLGLFSLFASLATETKSSLDRPSPS